MIQIILIPILASLVSKNTKASFHRNKISFQIRLIMSFKNNKINFQKKGL